MVDEEKGTPLTKKVFQGDRRMCVMIVFEEKETVRERQRTNSDDKKIAGGRGMRVTDDGHRPPPTHGVCNKKHKRVSFEDRIVWGPVTTAVGAKERE
ncbi:MAG: hypothetical protein GY820_34415, partial [Gammaproteobacteria bacterium]|nr:hypothetical protein [Gammaproteobacteria bacterium]